MGLPLGSGCVESANKLLVEGRLKGSGVHWARKHIDPMLALRSIAYNDRWEEDWPQIVGRLRALQAESAKSRREARREAAQQVMTESAPVVEIVAAQVEKPIPKPPAKRWSKPPADHPWRRFQFGNDPLPKN